MARNPYSKIGQQEFDKILSGGYISNTKIAGMSYNQLTRLVDSGRISVKELRSTYSQLRTTAKSRERTVGRESVVEQFGNAERQNFRPSKNLVTTSELLHELADVGKFLTSQRSTITGLREQREHIIDRVNSQGFEVDERNYRDFIEFMQWFNASEYAKKYDSDSEEVNEVFNSGASSPAEWQALFSAYSDRGGSSPVRQY